MDKDQLLLNYFSKDLTPEQEQLFNELLATDAEFKAQFNFEKNLQVVIRDKEASALKSKLVGFEKDITEDVPVRTLRPNYQKWAMAASIALLIAMGWLGYNNFSGPNYGKLYESNFSEYPNTVYAITRGESVESIERNAFSAYESGDYKTAIENFNKIPETDRKDYYDFYLGLSHMNLEQQVESKTFLNSVISSDTEFTPEAHWYLALISIKEKDKENAKQHLKILTSEYDYQKEKALVLLQELE
ncbi:hypothetical protein JQC67_06065 [Aurantibacter crassamenti]|uniref:tetratricopeptide repeat protein n=1 Tax=Aurantibacter crassamenti TaxID=1837375 RepID=UPI00193A7BC5|nr:tetratricopeptide repeat protein [Aurantibacter crassamenti]MBM1105703.1 hypothetical protein [Aurantibacter crassamenti]